MFVEQEGHWCVRSGLQEVHKKLTSKKQGKGMKVLQEGSKKAGKKLGNNASANRRSEVRS